MKIRLATLLTLLVVAMGIWYFLPDDERVIKQSNVDYNASDEELYVQVHKEDDRVWALYSNNYTLTSPGDVGQYYQKELPDSLVHTVTQK